MTWLDEMNALQTKLIAESPIQISDDLFNAMKLFRNAHREILQRGATSIHLSPFWSEADFILVPPVNGRIVTYLFLKEVAKQEGVPITWLYMLPFTAQIDDAARYINFYKDEIMYVDDEGNATPNCLMAYHDGVKDGLIDKDEPFIFLNTEFVQSYIDMTKQVLQTMADENNMTFEMVLDSMSPSHIDAPFPYENDDSPWGDV